MTGTPGAAAFYSLVTLILIAMVWVTLGRDLRADWLRYRLRALRDQAWELGYKSLAAQLELAIRNADGFTATRALLCSRWAAIGTVPDEPEEAARLRAQFARLALGHALPIWNGWRHPEALLEAMLASLCPAGDHL